MPPLNPTLQQLHHLDKSSLDFNDQLCNVLYGREYFQCLPNLQGGDLVWLVDYLDKALDGLDTSSPGFRKCLRELENICSTRKILPESYILSSSLLNIDPDPFAFGGSGDVYHATLDGSRVCVKRIRIYKGLQGGTKIFYREAVMRKRLTHPNILPLLGVTITPLQLISTWMPGGDLTGYIKNHPDADTLGLLSDAVKGLCYLHSCNVIHGDLKGPNILVDDCGNARITDFGFTTVTQNLDSMGTASCHHGSTPRWTAPEVLKEGPYSKEADIFAFAMVMIEVFTGKVPFSSEPPFAAAFAIMRGRRPPRPVHPTFTEDLWTLMQRCWAHDPPLRPEGSEVLEMLGYSELVSSPNCLLLNLAEIATDSKRRPDQALVDRIDGMLDDVICDRDRHELLNILCKMCSRQRMIPKSMRMDNCVNGELIEECNGGRATVFRAEHKGRPVAVKIIRVYLTSDFGKCHSEFCREAVAWRHLRHPNVLPLFGVNLEQHRLAMISEWMDHGNINEFVERSEGVNRVQLLVDAATGLEHMHGLRMVHGDLKGANILINRSYRACLADFGLSTIVGMEHRAAANASLISVASESSLMSFTAGGTTRWMSPELLYPEKYEISDDRPTKKSDCYALGMVVYEVLCGNVPYWDITNEGAVINAILNGDRPRKPERAENLGFTKGLWGIVQQCWLADASERPDVRSILSHLNHATWAWERRRLV